jgi:hypothetical protein
MPLQATSGAASYDAFGGGVPYIPQYIEEVFSTWLYTGNGATQTVTNGINLSVNGGLVWVKNRTTSDSNFLFDTTRGAGQALRSNGVFANADLQSTINQTFSTTGFSFSTAEGYVNGNGNSLASWTFRKQPKFFDVVTVTGQPTETTFNHNLGSVPGCVIIKVLNGTGDWFVYHRSTGSSQYLILNSTSGQAAFTDWCVVTSTTVTVKGGAMGNGNPHVVYLFAHDAGGFGLTGTDNVISCGSYTGNGSSTGPVITLGYEPQWLMVKNASSTGNWNIIDNMRGMPVGSADAFLEANTSDAEATADWVSPTATGFQITSTSSEVNTSSSTYIYIAIRRGPMKVPTTGTSVFVPVAYAGNSSTQSLTGFGFPPDLSFLKSRNQGYPTNLIDKLRGPARPLYTSSTNAEDFQSNSLTSFDQNGITLGNGSQVNTSTEMVGWNFRRAPGFFDEVCYTGTGSATAVAHNLGVAPEFTIIKSRNSNLDWRTKHIALPTNNCLLQSSSSAAFDACISASSSATFTPNSNSYTSSITYVAYLFATCPGVSKVGSYTGTGATQVINCGFTGGARFVLIKRTDSTGDWYVWDSARGIVAGNDPYLLLNSTAAEVTSTDYIDTASTGFEISSTAPAAINASGGTFIFLAIA